MATATEAPSTALKVLQYVLLGGLALGLDQLGDHALQAEVTAHSLSSGERRPSLRRNASVAPKVPTKAAAAPPMAAIMPRPFDAGLRAVFFLAAALFLALRFATGLRPLRAADFFFDFPADFLRFLAIAGPQSFRRAKA